MHFAQKNKHAETIKLKYSKDFDEEDIKNLKALFFQYAKQLGVDLSFQGFEEECKMLPGKYGSPDGDSILLYYCGIPAGCVAIRRMQDEVCEMKRLFVCSAFRGLQLGDHLVSLIIRRAKEINYKYMRLDTLSRLQPAIRLYKKIGFYSIDPYIYNPLEGAEFFELELK